MPGDLNARAPTRNRAEESRRGGGAAGLPRVARDELGAKMMDFAPADLCNPDPRLVLRKRLREEMEALHGILRKAELLASKTVGDGRGKDGRFLAAEARPAAMDADRPSSAKRMKMMPLAAAVKPMMSSDKISNLATKRRRTMPLAAAVEPRMSADEISNLVTKRRKTMPLAAVVNVKPRMSADEISNLATRVSLLSEDMPARILEFLKKECTGHEDGNSGEMEIDIGSMRHSALFELRKLLDEFAEEEKHQHQKDASTNASTSFSSPRQHEDGEIVEEDCYVATDTCSYASPKAADKVLCSPPRPLEVEDSEIADEEVTCGGAAPVATEKFAETGNSPSSSSSSSSGSSSSSSSSSGCSRSDSSDSDSSDSDSDDESVTSRPTPAVLPKTDDLTKQPEPVTVELCSSKCLTEKVTRSNPRSSSINCSSLPEDGEIEEEAATTIAVQQPEKLAETVISPTGSSKSSGSAGDGSVCSIAQQQQQPAARDRKVPLSEAEYRHLIAKGRQRQRRQCNPERKRAYEELEEKERSATPISDWIHPMQLKQLGITPVEHAVTSERRVPGRRSPVQRLLGLFLKAE